jgi:hypothetical protein
MRGLKKKRTVMLQGYQIYHNYIRPHEALDGKTPADACGIDIQGKNKWITRNSECLHQWEISTIKVPIKVKV